MKSIVELSRRSTPFSKPQALALAGDTFWMSSRATSKVYAVDRASLAVKWELATPQVVWGLAVVGDGDLRAVFGEDRDGVDARTIGRIVPGQGIDAAFSWPCPDGMGSHLSHDGTSLYLSQWYPKKLIAFGADGKPGRTIALPHEVVGHCYANGAFWLATTTNEESPTEYFLERCDAKTGQCETIARIGFSARALAFDGTHFWTNHREQNELVSFTV